MSETKLSGATIKRLSRKLGKRETHRIVADWLVCDRFARDGAKPPFTRRPNLDLLS